MEIKGIRRTTGQVLVCLGCLGMISAFLSCGSKTTEEKQLTIAVVPKGTTHIFWESVHSGAQQAAEELGIQVQWIGPEKEDDRQQQIALIDNLIVNRVSGIVLAPLDARALLRPVRDAVKQRIPVIIIDSGLEDAEDLYSSFVATDNLEGGRIAGRKMAEFLNGQGKIVLLRYIEGSASTHNREEGFLQAVKEFNEIEVVSDEQYAGATRAQAQQAGENLLVRMKGGDGDLMFDGIFCPNASSTYGMLQALRRHRLAGSVVFIGFDSDPPLIEALELGEMKGLVVQNPQKMGYLGVKMMFEVLNTRPVEKRIDTGVTFVTAADLSKPEIQNLINPKSNKIPTP